MKGKVLVINPGSTSTKIGFYEDGNQLFETNLTHSAEEIAKYDSVMDQGDMRRDAITAFLSENGVELNSIDVIMARGGLITPIEAGVYEVTQEMRDALVEVRNGVHACNLSALIADDMASDINRMRQDKGLPGICKAYIADAPTSDEMLPELKLTGHPAFERRHPAVTPNGTTVRNGTAVSTMPATSFPIGFCSKVSAGNIPFSKKEITRSWPWNEPESLSQAGLPQTKMQEC